jgi:hypothetical protein
MLRVIDRTRREDRLATEDRVILADGSVFVVQRANLSSAKALLGAEKAARRQADLRRARSIHHKPAMVS